MRATGIVRRIDDLGRIVIPKEIRKTMHIRESDPLEIFTEQMCIRDRCSPGHKGHDDLTSSPPSSRLSLAVSLECPSVMLATKDRGCARCGT